MFKDTAVTKVLDHKVTDRLFKLVVGIGGALFIFLLGRLYMMKEDAEHAQWMNIKKNADDVIELRVRIGVMEALNHHPVMIEDEVLTVDEDESKPDVEEKDPKKIHLGKMFDAFMKKRREERPEQVDEFIQRQSVEK
jgi:hypothetical protein